TFRYLWTGPGLPAQGVTTQCITPPLAVVSVPGTYTYTVTITDAQGSSTTCSETLVVNPGVICSINMSGCLGAPGGVTLTGPPGMSCYEWTGPATANIPAGCI